MEKKIYMWIFIGIKKLFYITINCTLYLLKRIIIFYKKFKIYFFINFVFLTFILIIRQIIINKEIENIKPIMDYLEHTSFTQFIIQTQWFKEGVNLFLKHLDLTPDYEKLLGLIIVLLIITIVIMIMSRFLKRLNIVLAGWIWLLFSTIYEIIRMLYSWEDITYKIAVVGEQFIDNNINIILKLFSLVADKWKMQLDLSKVNLIHLKEQIITNGITTNHDMIQFIIQYFFENLGKIRLMTYLDGFFDPTMIYGYLSYFAFSSLFLFAGIVLLFVMNALLTLVTVTPRFIWKKIRVDKHKALINTAIRIYKFTEVNSLQISKKVQDKINEEHANSIEIEHNQTMEGIMEDQINTELLINIIFYILLNSEDQNLTYEEVIDLLIDHNENNPYVKKLCENILKILKFIEKYWK